MAIAVQSVAAGTRVTRDTRITLELAVVLAYTHSISIVPPKRKDSFSEKMEGEKNIPRQKPWIGSR